MSLVSLIRSAPKMGEGALCKGLLNQQLFGSVTEEQLLATVAKAIPWATLSNRERTARLSAFIRQGPHMPGWRKVVAAALDPEVYERIWKPAADLASLSLELRGSWIWEHYLNAADEEERQHELYRAKAAWMAPLLAEGPDFYAIDYLTANWHCDKCGALSMSKLPEERRAFLLDQVKTAHAILEEEYMERLETRCRGDY